MIATILIWFFTTLFFWMLIGFVSGASISLWQYSHSKDTKQLKSRLQCALVTSVFGCFMTVAAVSIYLNERKQEK